MVEYVRRMMKRKLKLKNKEQQDAAAEFMCQDNSQICSVFAKVVRSHPTTVKSALCLPKW